MEYWLNYSLCQPTGKSSDSASACSTGDLDGVFSPVPGSFLSPGASCTACAQGLGDLGLLPVVFPPFEGSVASDLAATPGIEFARTGERGLDAGGGDPAPIQFRLNFEYRPHQREQIPT
jgi:hypothetical protein